MAVCSKIVRSALGLVALAGCASVAGCSTSDGATPNEPGQQGPDEEGDAADGAGDAADEGDPKPTQRIDAAQPSGPSSPRDGGPARELDAKTSRTSDARTDPSEGPTEGPARDAGSALPDASEPVVERPPGDCPRELVGWASVAGDGVSSTTGGGNATPVRPKSAAELMTYASDATPRVIEITGTLRVPSLQIASNKTLVGIGNDATLEGGLRIRGRKDEPVSNVIIRNLRIDGATTEVDNDAVQLYFAHHVWIDHSEIWDGPDGDLDMSHAVNWVTVSWTKVRYSENYKKPPGETNDHRFASLVGHSDNNAGEDTGRLKISFHHNWWAERVIERMPRVRFGQVHVFNNYFASPGNNYCVRAGRGASVLVESNFFARVNSPHEFNSAEDEATAHITARDNVYEATTGTQAIGGGGTPFTSVPYDPKLDAPASLPSLVKGCAGPR